VTKTDAKDPGARMPRQIPYIIANEGCERFSFYGMRNILQQFLPASIMMMSLPESAREGAAKEVFHIFVMGVYFFPLLGGYLADRFFGKFNTIFWFSLIYSVGQGCLALFPDNAAGFYTGLFLIALGSGGIKPLVASFMGDQFDDRNKHLAKIVFDAFYWIINFGSFFASLLMPLFLAQLGPRVAFGIPGALMLIATIVFVMAKGRYVMIAPQPPNPNSFSSVMKTALVTRVNGKLGSGAYVAAAGFALAAFGLVLAVLALPQIDYKLLPEHISTAAIICLALVILLAFVCSGASMQLDRARGKHSDDAVNGVRAVLSILIVFALVTPFHSLFDQKATEWVIQGKQMAIPGWEINLGPLGVWETNFLPSQMQAFNPFFVMILIPFNNLVLYPLLRRRGYEPTSLRRMTWGILFSGVAWIVVGALQIAIEGGGEKLNILYQIFPYVLLTFGEVLVSATGLEFAYSQAPLQMKGVIMSFWNLTTTIGQLWVLLVDAGIRTDRVTHTIEHAGISPTVFRMFFFAAFAFAAAIAFKLYVRRYKLQDHYRKRDPKVSRDAVAAEAAAAEAAGQSPLPEARDVSKPKD
jgi:POT family proton-dependent oligopeptide transporter